MHCKSSLAEFHQSGDPETPTLNNGGPPKHSETCRTVGIHDDSNGARTEYTHAKSRGYFDSHSDA